MFGGCSLKGATATSDGCFHAAVPVVQWMRDCCLLVVTQNKITQLRRIPKMITPEFAMHDHRMSVMVAARWFWSAERMSLIIAIRLAGRWPAVRLVGRRSDLHDHDLENERPSRSTASELIQAFVDRHGRMQCMKLEKLDWIRLLSSLEDCKVLRYFQDCHLQSGDVFTVRPRSRGGMQASLGPGGEGKAQEDDKFVPTWDGGADAFRRFKENIEWWLESENLQGYTNNNVSLCAKLVRKPSAPARSRANKFKPHESLPLGGLKICLMRPMQS